MKYHHYIWKRKVEDLLMWPLVAAGRLLARLRPLQQEYDVFFFFPFYHTGGAEKVHALICQAVGNSNCIVYFTRRSADRTFYNDFLQSGCTVKDISNYTGSKWLYPINIVYRGIISGYINRQQQRPVVFNGQCNFAYKLSPWVHRAVPQVELIHSFNTFSWIRLPFLPFIIKTVMISQLRVQDHLHQYKRLQVPAGFNERIEWIVNGIPLPDSVPPKPPATPLQVLYVGRGTSEKRVHLVAAMAQKAAQQQLPVQFIFMGDVEAAIKDGLRPFCHLLGPKSNRNEIAEVYNNAHVVIITSNTEGFPMVVEEGMAHGCAVMATPVGDIPYHVKHGDNGFIFSTVDDEATIVDQGVAFVQQLIANPHLLAQMGANNQQYARHHFGIDTFNRRYRQLIEQLQHG